MDGSLQLLLGIALFLIIGALIFSFAWRSHEKEIYFYQMPPQDYYYNVPVVRQPLRDGIMPVRRYDYNPWLVA